MNWQPIETAPRDGTPILGYCPQRGQRETRMGIYKPGTVGYNLWKKGGWPLESGWEYKEPSEIRNWRPTHWMPLFPPPTVNDSLTVPMDDDLDEPLGKACSLENPECESCQ